MESEFHAALELSLRQPPGIAVRINVLKFLTSFAVGGTERQFTYVAKSLNRSYFDVRVGCLLRKGTFLKEIETLNVPIAEYPIHSLCSTGMLRRQWRFARDLRRERVQLVHAYGFYANVFSIPAARLAGSVTIASVRDTGVFSDRIKAKTILQGSVCRLADRVIANSILLGSRSYCQQPVPRSALLDCWRHPRRSVLPAGIGAARCTNEFVAQSHIYGGAK